MWLSRILGISTVIVLVAGCADQMRMERQGLVPAASLEQSGIGYVAVPKNGTYGTRVYSKSGQQAADILASAFGRFLPEIRIGQRVESIDEGLTSAREASASYLIYPQILHWEDRATEWSGKRDRVDVKVSVFQVSDGTLLDSAILSGVSKWATLGGDHPQDLLPKPAQEFADSLF